MKKSQSPLRRQRGYTLIEVMVVVTVLGIIASIAVPHYREFVLQSRRDDARSTLQAVIAQQTLFYGNFGSTYTTAVASLGYDPLGGDANETASRDNYYAIELGTCGGSPITDCVQATASAIVGEGQEEDLECASYTLNTRGTESAEDHEGNPTTPDCWK